MGGRVIERDLFGARRNEYEIPPVCQLATCRSCDAAILWIRTAQGRAMPLSVATTEEREGIRYALPHFVDCPHAKDWSKQR